MNTYEWYLFFHIAGAFLLLAATGATTGSGIALGQTTRANTSLTLLNIMRISEYALRSAGAILVFVFGLLLVGEVDAFEISDGWVTAAMTILIVALAVDHGFLMRRVNKSREMAAALGDGPVSPELEARQKDPVTGIVGVALDLSFFVILWLMIAKPGA
ncbi:MAG: DUF2269 family protein [Tepidiformaceae bacterium]